MASIKKRGDHPARPWEVTWREPETKRLRRKSFRTRRDSETFRDTVSTEIRQGTYIDRRPVPFKIFAADWLARTAPTVTPSTHGLHEWAVNGYLIPAFNVTPIQAFKPDRIERWQADHLRQGTPGPRSVQIILGILNTILEDARAKGYIFLNPMEKVRRFNAPERELRYPKPPEVKALCELVGRFYGMLFLVMAFCGLRIGEVTGLRRSDLDLDRGLLVVQRQAIWRRKRDCPDGEPRWALAKPKSRAGIRVVEIPEPMRPLLDAHLATLAGAPNPLDLVFPSEAGTPLDPKNVRRRHFAPAMKALGIRGVRQHDLRRTFIAVHVEAGTHPKLVQDRVGHSDIRLTMDVYGKIAGKMKLGAAEAARLDALAGTALPAESPVHPPTGDAPRGRREIRLDGRKLRKALTQDDREQRPSPEEGGGTPPRTHSG
jgi:integrase